MFCFETRGRRHCHGGFLLRTESGSEGKILELLDQAREKKAIIYYDPNFRSSHKNEAMKLAPTIIENLEYADIVRGSLEDFLYMYNMQDIDKI